MKRILALLLTLMMALSLTACGGDNNADLVGTWKWTCDITEEFQKGVNEGAGMDVPVEAKVEMTFVLVFNEDGTFTLSVDKDALSATVQGYIDAMVPVTVDLVYQQLEDQGMSRADIDSQNSSSNFAPFVQSFQGNHVCINSNLEYTIC